MSVEWLLSYLNYLVVERNYSPLTVFYTRHILVRLLKWLNGRPLSTANLKAYIYYLRVDKNNAPRSVNKLVSTTRGYATWAVQQGFLNHDPTAGMLTMKVVHRFPYRVLSESEVLRLIQAPVKYRNPQTSQMYTLIVSLLATTGMRRKEVCDLDVSSFRFGDFPTILIMGKGRRERIIPIPPPLTTPLVEYFAYAHLPPRSPAWVSDRKTRLSPDAVGDDLYKRSQVARLGVRVHPQQLRGTLITSLATSEAPNMYKIASYVGQRNPAVLQEYYAQLMPKHLESVVTEDSVPWLGKIKAGRLSSGHYRKLNPSSRNKLLHQDNLVNGEIAVLSTKKPAF